MHPTQVDSQAPLFKILMTSADGLYHEKKLFQWQPRWGSGGPAEATVRDATFS